MTDIIPTMVEIEVGDAIVESLYSFTVPIPGALISVGDPPSCYNVKVIKQHWVIDKHPYKLNKEVFRCVLVCEKIVPEAQSKTPSQKTTEKFKSVGGKAQMNEACPKCSMTNKFSQIKCTRDRCPMK